MNRSELSLPGRSRRSWVTASIASFHGLTSNFEDPNTKYALYLNRGHGYLLLDVIRQGEFDTVSLVLSLGDGKTYIHKIENDYYLRSPAAPNSEVVCSYRTDPSVMVAELIDDWELKDPRNHTRSKSATIWDFYDGGDLQSLLHAHARASLPIPEEIVWKFLAQMLTIVDQLHHGTNCQVHHDIFPRHVYLERSEANKMAGHAPLSHWDAFPDFRLGGLRNVTLVDPESYMSSRRDSQSRTTKEDALDDIGFITDCAWAMMLCTHMDPALFSGRTVLDESKVNQVRHNANSLYTSTLRQFLSNITKRCYKYEKKGQLPSDWNSEKRLATEMVLKNDLRFLHSYNVPRSYLERKTPDNGMCLAKPGAISTPLIFDTPEEAQQYRQRRGVEDLRLVKLDPHALRKLPANPPSSMVRFRVIEHVSILQAGSLGTPLQWTLTCDE